MRATFSVRLLACAALVGTTASAFAQPPSSRTSRRTGSAAPAPSPTTRPGSATASAYLSGKQALVGWHAPSTRAVGRDGSGRPMLTLTTLNRGETLSVPAVTDDGGFESADLDRVAHLL